MPALVSALAATIMRILVILWLAGLAILSAFASAGTNPGLTTIETDGARFKVTLSNGRVPRSPL